jgi:hypothetical protein
MKPKCKHCRQRTQAAARGLCSTCWSVLRSLGTLDTLYPPQRPPKGTRPLEWYGRKPQ